MVKILSFLSLSLVFFPFGSSLAQSRYQAEIDLIRSSYKRFVLHADRRYRELEHFKRVWQDVDFYLGGLEQVALWNPGPPPAALDEDSRELKRIMDERVLVESTMSELRKVRPWVEAKFRESKSICDDFPHLLSIHARATRSIRQDLDELEEDLLRRKAKVDESLRQWTQWQINAMILHDAQVQERFLDQLKMNELIQQLPVLFRAMHLRFYTALYENRRKEAAEVLDGLVWLRSVIPVFFLGKPVTKIGRSLLDAYLNDAEDKEEELRKELAQRPLRGAILMRGAPMRAIALWDEDQDAMEKAIKSELANAWNEVVGEAEGMAAGNHSAGGKELKFRDPDGREVTLHADYTIEKSVCAFNEERQAFEATAKIGGVMRMERAAPAERVRTPTEIEIGQAIDHDLFSNTSQNFEKTYSFSCELPKERAEAPPERIVSNPPVPAPPRRENEPPPDPGPGISADALPPAKIEEIEEVPQKITGMLDRAIEHSRDSVDRKELSGVKDEVERWKHAKGLFDQLSDQTARTAGAAAGQSTQHTSQLRKRMKKEGSAMGDAANARAAAEFRQETAWSAIRSYVSGAPSVILGTLDGFISGLSATMDTPAWRGAAKVKDAIDDLQNRPRSQPQQPVVAMTQERRNVVLAMARSISQRNDVRYDKSIRTGPDAYDCSGLVWILYKDAGLNYGENKAPSVREILNDSAHFNAIAESDAVPGDLIAQLGYYSRDDHVGVVTGRGVDGDLLEISAQTRGNNAKKTPGTKGFKTSVKEAKVKIFATELIERVVYLRWKN